jgi:hypothetical protein
LTLPNKPQQATRRALDAPRFKSNRPRTSRLSGGDVAQTDPSRYLVVVDLKTHCVDLSAGAALQMLTSATTDIVQMAMSALPVRLQGMCGVVSYYASSYRAVSTHPSMTVGGELVLVRKDGVTAKGYDYAFGTSPGGEVCFKGPSYRFPAHHSPIDRPTPVAEMFGHVSALFPSIGAASSAAQHGAAPDERPQAGARG